MALDVSHELYATHSCSLFLTRVRLPQFLSRHRTFLSLEGVLDSAAVTTSKSFLRWLRELLPFSISLLRLFPMYVFEICLPHLLFQSTLITDIPVSSHRFFRFA